jgi:hypothetical protein
VNAIREPTLGERLKALGQRDGVGFAVLDLLQIEAGLICVGQILAIR